MTGRIDDVPNGVTDAGQDFDYVDPPRLASVVLVNAPLDPDHVNVGLNRATYDTFIDAEVTAGRALVLDAVNLQNPEHDLEVEVEYETAATFYNYGRVTIGSRKWYVFYTPTYHNKTVTRFVADIDEFPSYDWTLGYTQIDRGHVAVAASQNDTYGAQYLTAPEPIQAEPVRGVASATLLGSVPSAWTVLVVSANDLRGDGSGVPFFDSHVQSTEIGGAADLASSATVDSDAHVLYTVPDALYPWDTDPGTGTPNVYVPIVTASPGSTIDGVNAGGGVYLFTARGFAEYMTIMQGAPWVISGISDVRLVPSWAVGGGGDAAFSARVPSRDPLDSSWAAAASIPNYVAAVVSATTSPTVLANWRDTVLATVGAVGWRKLVTGQFCQILVGAGEGFQTFKPDQWQTDGLGFQAATGAAHGDPSIRLTPTGYNDLGPQLGLSSPVGGRAGVQQSGFGLAASNPAAQDTSPYLSAFASHQTWLVNVLNKELAVTLGLTGIQLNAGVQGIQSVLGGATGAAGAALGGGGPAGIAAGALGSVSGLATAGITASNTITMLDISTDGSFDIGARQLGLSGLAQVTAFNAWFQSLFATSGQGVPDQLASGWRAIVGQAFQAVITVPSAERIKTLLSEWKRYGYMIGQVFKPTRLDPMTKMSYWLTTDAVIVGSVPQQRRQTIASAFDRGTTVWTSIADIGTDVTGTNTPRAGISY